ncbi:tetratricopeptide repeat protein [Saccharothrix luteola]|uniref:tetratricopeptide repeat protein n=1 Tax=Saccharothrix luteola TaxID=2893018 RepID=UPI001E363EB2|nr:tetratricopeptide repeat protein [Saccharothrix luteola]MCC8245057.1 tetratricopeptide repeat protein [Saccharothrix luteola]
MTDPTPIAAQPRQESTEPDTDARRRFDPDHVLTTLHATMTRPESAVELLTRTWRAVPADADQAWLRRLCDLGTELATTLPTSLLLATAFRHAAQTLRTHGLLHLAAIQGMRELAIHRLHDDNPDATATALHDLAQTYRAQHRLHKVIDCADETLETYLLHHHDTGTARTLHHLGGLMIDAGRHDSAVKYLTRADTKYRHVFTTTERAHGLAALGQALWLSGKHAPAHRAFNQALALTIGIDDLTAQQFRALAARPDDLARSPLQRFP